LLVFKYKVDINLINDNDFNAFHVAAYEQNAQIANLLLKEKIDIGIPTKEFGNYVLVQASKRHHTNLVKLMIQLGADFNARDAIEGKTPIAMAAQAVAWEDNEEKTPLKPSDAQMECVKVLLACDPDLASRDIHGRAVLNYNLHKSVEEMVTQKYEEQTAKESKRRNRLNQKVKLDEEKKEEVGIEEKETEKTPFGNKKVNQVKYPKRANELLEIVFDSNNEDVPLSQSKEPAKHNQVEPAKHNQVEAKIIVDVNVAGSNVNVVVKQAGEGEGGH